MSKSKTASNKMLRHEACYRDLESTFLGYGSAIGRVKAQRIIRLLTVALQGSSSTLWAKVLLSEQTCLRINLIMGNTLNTMLLEKSIEFLLTVVNNKEVATILLLPWIKLGLPNLVLNLLSSELSNLDDDNKPVRMSFLDSVLCLVEEISTNDSDLEMILPNEELCLLVRRVFKLPEKFEFVGACVSAVVIIANLLADGKHIASQLLQDHEFIQGLLETIPFVSDDPQARVAFWCILESLFVQIAEKDINNSSFCHLMSFFLEKSSLIMEDLDGHYTEDSNPLNSARAGTMVKTLLRIDGILERWLAQKIEKVEDTSNIADVEAQAERLLCYCKKYSSLLSTPNAQE